MPEEDTYENPFLRIAVLFGGSSPERCISLSSGRCVAASLDRCGHHVRLIDPSETDLLRFDWSETDAAFNMLHGPFGEDGQVQQILEAASVPYTGCDPHCSRLAFSKSAAKERFRKAGIPTPDDALIQRPDSPTRLHSLAEAIGYPLVVKPDQQGSSIGVQIVQSPEDLLRATRGCFQFGDLAVVERAVVGGAEWTLAVIDAQPLPLIRITPHSRFFDFSAKYEDDRTAYAFDAPEPETVTRTIVQTGVEACRALGTTGIVRVDLMTDDAGQPWVLEVNTVPGMTDHSLVPKAALQAGITLPELCDTEIRAALRRHHRRHDSHHRSKPTEHGVQRRAG